jgi:hypothetical protein
MTLAIARLPDLNSQTPPKTHTVVLGNLFRVSNPAGALPGATVQVVVDFGEPLPGTFGAVVTPRQPATAFISNVTANGFTANITPLLASTTLAAGTFDVFVYA